MAVRIIVEIISLNMPAVDRVWQRWYTQKLLGWGDKYCVHSVEVRTLVERIDHVCWSKVVQYVVEKRKTGADRFQASLATAGVAVIIFRA